MQQVLIIKDLLNIAVRQHELSWEPFRTGVDIYRLYKDGEKGAAAALLRYQPGASVPQHDHIGFEHIFVLSGSQTDQNGEHQVGTLVINPPSSNHNVISQDGCIVLAIWEKPISITTSETTNNQQPTTNN
ncbi:MAG: transcription negative regulator ChrR [Microcoleus sp. SIO2G3]|nr:transcription negative regulator ChrR [Microcoleus sp. SIO2G3]